MSARHAIELPRIEGLVSHQAHAELGHTEQPQYGGLQENTQDQPTLRHPAVPTYAFRELTRQDRHGKSLRIETLGDCAFFKRVHHMSDVDLLRALDHAGIATCAEPYGEASEHFFLKAFSRQVHQSSRRVIHVKREWATSAAKPTLQAMTYPLATDCLADPFGELGITFRLELNDPLDFHRRSLVDGTLENNRARNSAAVES